jgi:hypothetical protein
MRGGYRLMVVIAGGSMESHFPVDRLSLIVTERLQKGTKLFF